MGKIEVEFDEAVTKKCGGADANSIRVVAVQY
jgi:hypothetical protein